MECEAKRALEHAILSAFREALAAGSPEAAEHLLRALECLDRSSERRAAEEAYRMILHGCREKASSSSREKH